MINATVNDVKMTIRTGAARNYLGVEIPTIALACTSGISIIRDDGNVSSWANRNGMNLSDFNELGEIICEFIELDSPAPASSPDVSGCLWTTPPTMCLLCDA